MHASQEPSVRRTEQMSSARQAGQISSTRRTARTKWVMILGWCISALISPLCFAAGAASTDGDWPAFRGPNADGITTGEGAFSSSASISLNVKWKTTIGSGYSGVVVADGHVVTMFSDGTSDVVVALKEDTGKELWRFPMDETYKGHDGSHTGPISTPVLNDGRVIGLAPRGRLFALNLGTGKLLWSTDLVKDHGAVKPYYGFTTSPMMMDGVLVVQIGAEDGAVAGFEPGTGKLLWKAGSDTIQYQSPIPTTLQGRRQILAVGSKNLFGIDAGNGSVLWEYPHTGSGARGAGSLTPVSAGKNRFFLSYRDDKSTVVDLTFDENGATGKEAWQSRSIRNSYNVPIYNRGHLYAYSSRFLTCVDAATGESVWRSRQPGDGFLILVDGHLVIATKKGGVHVALASSQGYEEKASLSLFNDLIWSPPSFAHGSIFVRSLGEVARVDIGSGAASAPTHQVTDANQPKGRFSRFLSGLAHSSDKKGLLDRFIESIDAFPLIEGDNLVHFIYRGRGEDLAVAGDLWGARQEHTMTRVEGTDLFYHSMRIEPDARANYVFIRDYEQLLDPRNPRKTTTTVYKEEMEMSFSGTPMEMSWFSMPKWRAPAHLDKTPVSRHGRVETVELESKTLETKHSIDVYLPAGYDQSKERYPVAYIHGGKAVRESGAWPASLDRLLGRRAAPLIAVFINASPRGKASEYAEMCAKELIPFVDGKYRTIASPDARANVGMGFSGYTALHCTFKQPGVVSKVACQSAFMFGSMTKELYPLISTASEQPLQVYLEWGKYDLRNPHEAWDLAETNRKFAELLRKKGYAPLGGEVHDGTGWSSWRNRTDVVLGSLFPAKANGMRTGTE